ncbi:MAG: alanine--glyoxylate aminotransferase family protein [Synergistaceae bacterium]|jgi:aspartate aminotransferase-like enzyme|nr:alanine--glyoxylate aminotransferase family protein [Synergistaceae bacterium]
MNKYLLTPGPVPVSTEVSLKEARPLIGHRGSEFSSLFSSIEAKLSRLLRSDGKTVIFPASGTGALECLSVNFTGPDTKVISVSCGVFGDRFREITALTGSNIIDVNVTPGEGVTPGVVARAVDENPDASVLLLTQNETSTGVFNHIDEIISVLPEKNRPLILVDGVSSVGAMPCFPEAWGIDALATASQKGLLTPPGLGLVWLSERAWEIAENRKCNNYYFDLMRQKKVLYKEAPENPYTPPVTLYYALNAALDEILTSDWFDQRRRAARALAAGIEALGFELLVKEEKFRSPGVTAFSLKSGDTSAIAKSLKSMGVEPAGGQGKFKGKLIRMSHYHDFRWPEISLALGSLYAALGNARNNAGDFMAAALKRWEEQ